MNSVRVPALPNNGFDLNEKTAASPSQYLPTIAVSSFPQVDRSELCDQTNYDRAQTLVDDQLAEVLESESLEAIEFHKVCCFFGGFFCERTDLFFPSSMFWIT